MIIVHRRLGGGLEAADRKALRIRDHELAALRTVADFLAPVKIAAALAAQCFGAGGSEVLAGYAEHDLGAIAERSDRCWKKRGRRDLAWQ